MCLAPCPCGKLFMPCSLPSCLPNCMFYLYDETQVSTHAYMHPLCASISKRESNYFFQVLYLEERQKYWPNDKGWNKDIDC